MHSIMVEIKKQDGAPTSPGPTINPNHQIVLDCDLKEANFNQPPTHEESRKFVEHLIAMNSLQPSWINLKDVPDEPDR